MAVKLARYIFRRIGGRIVPIRIGAEAATAKAVEVGKGISTAIARKAKLLFKHQTEIFVRGGKFVKRADDSGTSQMLRFMKNSGAVRFYNSGDQTMIDFSRKLTDAQRHTIKRLATGDYVAATFNKQKGSIITEEGLHWSKGMGRGVTGFLNSALSRMGKPPGKGAPKLEAKALKHFGTTRDPREVGYIMPSGKALDLSGKKFGGPSGTRELDHREAAQLVPHLRPGKATDQDIRRALTHAQKTRKASEANKQLHVTLAQDIKKFRTQWNPGSTPEDRAFKNKIIRNYLTKLREVRANRGKK